MGMVPDRESLREHTKSPAERTGKLSGSKANAQNVQTETCRNAFATSETRRKWGEFCLAVSCGTALLSIHLGKLFGHSG